MQTHILKQRKIDNVWAIVAASFITLIAIAVSLVLRSLLPYETKIVVFGMIWLVIGFANVTAWVITRQLVNCVLGALATLMALSYLFDNKGSVFLILFILLLGVYFYGIVRNLRCRHRYCQILERAAEPVRTAADGYTQRPMPMGKLAATDEQRRGFATFVRQNDIAMPYHFPDRIVLVVNSSLRFWVALPDFQKDSFVTMGNDASIIANIARKDYRQYREALTFDQLCRSFGNLFGRLFQLYMEGREDRIFELLDGKAVASIETDDFRGEEPSYG